MSRDLLEEQRIHLAKLLEAIQRCTYFLHHSQAKIAWPLDPQFLARHKKDVELYETLAAINERFAKLQDSLAAAMRHTALLMSESVDSFLAVLALFEKHGVIASTADLLNILPASDAFETEFTAIVGNGVSVLE